MSWIGMAGTPSIIAGMNLQTQLQGERLFDPFGERSSGCLSKRVQVLGSHFEFRSDSPELLALVDVAYGGLPGHEMPGGASDFDVELRLTEGTGFAGLEEPPEARMLGGAGFLGALMDAANLALAFPEARRGLVAISRDLLRFAYHARYELLEFVVFTLASRAQGLVPLHAGCVGAQGKAALLVGESGAGKSTLALHCMLQGLDFLTEDAAFVAPRSLMATGVANFLHLRFDALAFLEDHLELAAGIRHSPVIRRRSGVEKYEIDLRQDWVSLAPTPLNLSHIVFVSKEPAGDGDLLVDLAPEQLLARLARSQPYAAGQPSWTLFAEQVARLHGHQLRRGVHPREAAVALRELLGAPLMT
jgi:energy-coupling factor transporter ATP-binding protein EcfA2